jgi:DNA polymerase delta subunit 1
VLAHIHGFKPYFYVAAPAGFMNNDLDKLKDAINVSVIICWRSLAMKVKLRSQSAVPAHVLPVVSCTIKNARSLWGYKGDEKVPFIKITVSDPKSMPKVRGAMERGQIEMLGHEVLTYESNIAYTLRFMIDTKVRSLGAG